MAHQSKTVESYMKLIWNKNTARHEPARNISKVHLPVQDTDNPVLAGESDHAVIRGPSGLNLTEATDLRRESEYLEQESKAKIGQSLNSSSSSSDNSNSPLWLDYSKS